MGAPEEPRETRSSNYAVSMSSTDASRRCTVSLTVGQGEIVALIGSNGAGKPRPENHQRLGAPARGEVRLRGAPIHTLGAEQIARLGVATLPRAADCSRE